MARWRTLCVAGFFGALLAGCSTEEEGPPPGGTDGLCPVGMAQCPCTAGGGCDPGLECLESIDVCVVPGCAIGSAGCACTAAGSCDPGLLCRERVCVSDRPCNDEDVGSEGCQCTGGGACDPGLECISDTCVHPPATTTDTPTTTDASTSGDGSSTAG